MDKRRVLFVATRSGTRAQLAAVLLRGLGGESFIAASASTGSLAPDPWVGRVLAKLGFDASGLVATPLEHYRGRPFDDVITLCDGAGET